MARNMVATSQPLAVQAGLQMLYIGGNAIDAALAAAMTLPVVEPTMNGLGGDLFAFVWNQGKLHSLNSAGDSPAGWNRSRFEGLSEMPLRGWDAVTVPGQVAGWMDLWRRFGSLSLEQISGPAIRYAEQGFPVSPITASLWGRAPQDLRAVTGFNEAFFRNGRAPVAGEMFSFPAQARTLKQICATEGESFYRGEIAEAISRQANEQGGALSLEDLRAHRTEWVQPCQIEINGYTVHELPPNSQGLTVLIALGILRELNAFSLDPNSAESIHLCIEATKLAMADAGRYFSDARHGEFPVEAFLERGYLRKRAALVDPAQAQDPGFGVPMSGGTVLITAADEKGNLISLIQSNFFGFGSGVVLKDYGISFHNRGKGFSLDPASPNCVGPRKKPFHTLIPGFVTKDGKPYLSFGLMGGSMQAQGHVQVLNKILAHDWNPQAASDDPRWRIKSGKEVWFEEGFNEATVKRLQALGHAIVLKPYDQFGGAQIILNQGMSYLAGSDHRKDGYAAGF